MTGLNSRVKNAIKKQLIGDYPFSDYLSVEVPPEAKKGKTYWCVDGKRISVDFGCVLYDPPTIALHIHPDQQEVKVEESKSTTIDFFDESESTRLGSMQVSFVQQFLLNQQTSIYLFKITNGNSYVQPIRLRIINQILYWQRKWRHQSFLSTFDKTRYTILSSFFIHPRTVQLVTLPVGDGQTKYFPIDLFMKVNDTVIFGVRNSNEGSRFLQKGAVFCMSDVLGKYKAKVYELGNFGEKTSDEIGFEPSKHLGLLIPSIYHSYLELEITEVVQYERQTLYCARVLHSYKPQDQTEEKVMAHVQLLRYLKLELPYDHALLK